jgi:hypothetical protein
MSLLRKLRINAEMPLWLINAPDDVQHLFEGVVLKTRIPEKASINQLVLFVEDSVKLNSMADKLRDRISESAVIWVAYPKKGSKLEGDLHRDNKVWEYALSMFSGVASAAIDETWSGIRFKKKDPRKPDTRIPMEERRTEGIDYVARTVKLPWDAVEEMKVYRGLEEFFYAMSFSHKREYVEAIMDAKKPETRQRRIEGMIKNLLKMREEKDAKKRK